MIPPDPSPRRPSPQHPVRILLVEDDLDQAHLVKFLLESGGDHSVVLVQDGDRAVQLLGTREWDLLITDLNLPGAHGTEVVEAARAGRPELPILATTGYTGPQYSQRAMERGADRVLVKPLDRDELLDEVRRLVQEGRPHRMGGHAEPSGPPPHEPEPERPPPRSPYAGETAAAIVSTGGRPGPTRSKGTGREGDRVGKAGRRDSLQVLAVGIYPGEAEAGCGGALLRHLDRGDRIVILHLARRGTGSAGSVEVTFAREAARHLGVRSFVGNVAVHPTDAEGSTAMGELRRLAVAAVREIRPDVLYLPTTSHTSAMHRVAHAAAREAADEVEFRLGYDAGRITLGFAPDLVLPLDAEHLERKIQALQAYEGHPVPHLDPAFIRASARYWARYTESAAAEPLERLGSPMPFADGVTDSESFAFDHEESP